MAGRKRNTFLKRQKEMERVQRARLKMARRHGRVAKEGDRDAEMPPPEAAALGAALAESVNTGESEAQV